MNCHGDRTAPRAIVMQQKMPRPVQFDITEATRDTVGARISKGRLWSGDYLFPSRIHESPHLSTRQYARIVGSWVRQIGLDPCAYLLPSSQSSAIALERGPSFLAAIPESSRRVHLTITQTAKPSAYPSANSTALEPGWLAMQVRSRP